MVRVRTRLAVLTVLALTACSSGGGAQKSLDVTPSPGQTTLSPGASKGATPTLAPGSVAAPIPGVTASTSTGTAASAPPVRPLSTVAPGKTAAQEATAPGVYTLDSSGTVTLGNPGTPQDASGEVTLTVDPIKDGVQHSTLHSDSTGDTVQDLLVRDTGTYAASLKLTSPAFTKEFRPSPAVLLVPDPARVGASWSWSGRSTDGKTTVSTTNKIVRPETLTIGGQKVACFVISTRLILAGDVDYTADITTWWAPEHRLPVKDRAVGKGSYNGFPFSTDITGVMRSVTPS